MPRVPVPFHHRGRNLKPQDPVPHRHGDSDLMPRVPAEDRSAYSPLSYAVLAVSSGLGCRKAEAGPDRGGSLEEKLGTLGCPEAPGATEPGNRHRFRNRAAAALRQERPAHQTREGSGRSAKPIPANPLPFRPPTPHALPVAARCCSDGCPGSVGWELAQAREHTGPGETTAGRVSQHPAAGPVTRTHFHVRTVTASTTETTAERGDGSCISVFPRNLPHPTYARASSAQLGILP